MLQGLPWNICWNAHGLTCVTFKPFSLYSIHCTCTYAPCSWQKIIISCAYREWFHGFRTPMKNSNLLNSLSKVIDNNKQSEPLNPHPTPLFRFLGKIFIRAWMCLIFFLNLNLFDLFSSSEVCCDHEHIVLLDNWTKPLIQQNIEALVGRRGWVGVKAKYIYVNFSMDLILKMLIDRLID